MKLTGKALVNFFIYSGLNISIAASVFSAEVFVLFGLDWQWSFLAFVFFSTLLTYSLHRIIGIRKTWESFPTGRFEIIKSFRLHIQLYALIAGVGLAICCFYIPFKQLLLFGVSGMIAFLYVLPVMHSQKRLRDIPYIKIMLIAITWSFVAHIPLFSDHFTNHNNLVTGLSIFEKLLYIFLITLPFDIRDLDIDAHQNVRTLAAKMGAFKSYKLIYLLLVICSIIWLVIGFQLQKSVVFYLCSQAAIVLSGLCIYASEGKTSDLYYSGVLDGIISIRSVLILLALTI